MVHGEKMIVAGVGAGCMPQKPKDRRGTHTWGKKTRGGRGVKKRQHCSGPETCINSKQEPLYDLMKLVYIYRSIIGHDIYI